ncbi:putative hexokinase-1 protein [Rutstroemia sp. NJR-2017a WRK4]|nr:putative hexokinase-1 protein [Rutstroemia sp. NJR-2017a WRK4]
MQQFIAAMIQIRRAFYAALLRSLLKTKSVIEILIKFWIPPPSSSLSKEHNTLEVDDASSKKIEKFLKDVEASFREATDQATLLALSDELKKEFEKCLRDNPLCMLPSYNHQLPHGDECGTYLALDVGGSTFRVALIRLAGSQSGGGSTQILQSKSFKIGNAERCLQGMAFFEWMADRIADTLSEQAEGHDMSKPPLSMGLSWSFPIDQKSLRSGLLMGMGKGFLAAHGLLGKDLGDIIQECCSLKGLNIQLNAIVNDSSATLLSKAYLDPTTRFALILGTGMNAAAHLPVHLLSAQKFGIRPQSWHESAKHVIVNTELSMFGGKILPCTKWDRIIKESHPAPEFQPFEHLTGGGYLGEIVRLVLVDGIQTAGLFGGVVPASLREKWTLETETLSRIESDPSPLLPQAIQIFSTAHPSPHTPTISDIRSLRLIASLVTQRASALLAAGVHSLWSMRNEAEGIKPGEAVHTVVAYNGSVLENYPGFRAGMQGFLDGLVKGSGGEEGGVELVYAEESSLVGAAVAVGCCGGGED